MTKTQEEKEVKGDSKKRRGGVILRQAIQAQRKI